MRETDLLEKHNGRTAGAITNRSEVYARQMFHTYFYVFDKIEDFKAWKRECKEKVKYAFYDGLGLYSQEEVDHICNLREQGRADEIRY